MYVGLRIKGTLKLSEFGANRSGLTEFYKILCVFLILYYGNRIGAVIEMSLEIYVGRHIKGTLKLSEFGANRSGLTDFYKILCVFLILCHGNRTATRLLFVHCNETAGM
jgi:hypothetical protein